MLFFGMRHDMGVRSASISLPRTLNWKLVRLLYNNKLYYVGRLRFRFKLLGVSSSNIILRIGSIKCSGREPTVYYVVRLMLTLQQLFPPPKN